MAVTYCIHGIYLRTHSTFSTLSTFKLLQNLLFLLAQQHNHTYKTRSNYRHHKINFNTYYNTYTVQLR